MPETKCLLQTVRDQIIVQKVEDAKMTPGGIALPDTSHKPTIRGRVLAVGNGHLTSQGIDVPLSVKLDDVVVFEKNIATVVEVEGESYYVLREQDVRVILRPTTATTYDSPEQPAKPQEDRARQKKKMAGSAR